MRKTNSKVLEKAVTGLISRLESTEKFVLAQAPDIAKEMILEATTENKRELVLFSITSLLTFVLSALCVYFALDGRGEGYGFVAVFSLFFFVGFFTSAFARFTNLKFVQNCPKLFLLREFRKLL